MIILTFDLHIDLLPVHQRHLHVQRLGHRRYVLVDRHPHRSQEPIEFPLLGIAHIDPNVGVWIRIREWNQSDEPRLSHRGLLGDDHDRAFFAGDSNGLRAEIVYLHPGNRLSRVEVGGLRGIVQSAALGNEQCALRNTGVDELSLIDYDLLLREECGKLRADDAKTCGATH